MDETQLLDDGRPSVGENNGTTSNKAGSGIPSTMLAPPRRLGLYAPSASYVGPRHGGTATLRSMLRSHHTGGPEPTTTTNTNRLTAVSTEGGATTTKGASNSFDDEVSLAMVVEGGSPQPTNAAVLGARLAVGVIDTGNDDESVGGRRTAKLRSRSRSESSSTDEYCDDEENKESVRPTGASHVSPTQETEAAGAAGGGGGVPLESTEPPLLSLSSDSMRGSTDDVVVVGPSAPGVNSHTRSGSPHHEGGAVTVHPPSEGNGGPAMVVAGLSTGVHVLPRATQLTYGNTLLVQDLSPRTDRHQRGGDTDDERYRMSNGGEQETNPPLPPGVVLGRQQNLNAERRRSSLSHDEDEELPATIDDGVPKFTATDILNIQDDEEDKAVHDDINMNNADMTPVAAEDDVATTTIEDAAQEAVLIESPSDDAFAEEPQEPTPNFELPFPEKPNNNVVAHPASVMQPQPLISIIHKEEEYDSNNDAPLIAAPPPPPQHVNHVAPARSPSSKAPSSRASVPSLSTTTYEVGEAVETKWGAAWYPATVVSVLGKAVEVEWRKDHSRVHVPFKHVRRPKVSAQPPPPADESVGKTPVPPASITSSSKKDTKHTTPPHASRGEEARPTSTQLVHLIDEEDAAAQRERVQKQQQRQPQQLLGASPSPPSRAAAARGQSSNEQSGNGSSHPTAITPTALATNPRTPATSSSSPRNDPLDIFRSGGAAAVDPYMDDFGDSATPPTALMYITSTALAELPSDARARWKRDMPRTMFVRSLRDVVSWAMNSTYQSMVPFFIIVSHSAVSRLQRSGGHHHHQEAGGMDDDQRTVLIAAALGLTALHHKWVTATLRSVEAGGFMTAQEPFVVDPTDVVVVSSRSSPPKHASYSTATSYVAKVARLLPAPRPQRVLFGDVMWCPMSDPSSEDLIEAAGGCVVREAREVLQRLDDPSLNGVLMTGGSASGGGGGSNVFLYVTPGGRVGSALRGDQRLSALVQFDLPALQQAVVKHFHQTICTRPVSVAGGSITPSPGRHTAGTAPPPPAAIIHHQGAAALTASSIPATMGPFKDGSASKQPILETSLDGHQATRRCLAMDDSQSHHMDAHRCDDEEDEDSSSRHDHVADVLPTPPPPPFTHLHQPEVAVASSSQPMSTTMRPPAGGGAVAIRRRLPHDLRIVIPHSQSSQAPPPQHHILAPQQHSKRVSSVSRHHHLPGDDNDPRHALLQPLYDEHAHGGGGGIHSSSSTAGGFQIGVGDDFYFSMMMPAHDDNDVETVIQNEEDSGDGHHPGTRPLRHPTAVSVHAIGRIAAVSENGDFVTMRPYHVTSVSLARIGGGGGRIGGGAALKRPREEEGASGAAITGHHTNSQMLRLVTIALTDDFVQIPISQLDVDTPLFVVDEQSLQHLYVLQRPPPPQVPVVETSQQVALPEIVAVTCNGTKGYIEVGTRIAFRPLHQTDDGNPVQATVRMFQRDAAVNGLVLVVELANNTNERGERLASRAVITPDMVVGVIAPPPPN